jgi:CheY-like chemotaxis protein/HPt (histidine-containing phosphotransfer) domain-containing protein
MINGLALRMIPAAVHGRLPQGRNGGGRGAMAVDQDRGASGLRGRAVVEQAPLILVAEDNEVNRDLIGRQLQRIGLRCEMASSGRLALARWMQGDIDMVLTDLRMPDMSGFDLCEAIRAYESRHGTRHVPIIAVSANAYDEQAQECLDRGMDDFLPKPVVMAQLRLVLAKWIAPAVPDQASVSASSARRDDPVRILDRSSLVAFVGEDEDAIRMVLDDFTAHAQRIAGELAQAWTSRSLVHVSHLAHKLKSSARAVGAAPLGCLCQDLENAADANDVGSVSRLMKAVAPSVHAVVAEIRGHR